MRLRAFLLGIVVACTPSVVDALVISSSPNVPPLGAHYATDSGVTTNYFWPDSVSPTTMIVVTELRILGFTSQTPPPLDVGASVVHAFDALVEGLWSVNEGAPIPFSVLGSFQEMLTKDGGSNGTPEGTFATELLALDLVGLPGGAILRQSQVTPTKGKTTIAPEGGGVFRIDSFFDVFTELSLDDRSTWVPSVDKRFENGKWVPSVDPRFTKVKLTTPEPGTFALLGLGVIAVACSARRRARATLVAVAVLSTALAAPVVAAADGSTLLAQQRRGSQRPAPTQTETAGTARPSVTQTGACTVTGYGIRKTCTEGLTFNDCQGVAYRVKGVADWEQDKSCKK